MPIDIRNAETPALWRRLAVIVYDLLLIAALLVIADVIVVLPLGAIWQVPAELIAANPVFRGYLLVVIVGFFTGFWLRGGQTLGMRAWRVRLVRDDGAPLRLWDTLLRQLAAVLSWIALGLGFAWSLLDKERLTWHDRLTGTRLVMLEKPAKKR